MVFLRFTGLPSCPCIFFEKMVLMLSNCEKNRDSLSILVALRSLGCPFDFLKVGMWVLEVVGWVCVEWAVCPFSWWDSDLGRGEGLVRALGRKPTEVPTTTALGFDSERGNLTAHPPPQSPCMYLLLGCFRTYLIKKLRKQIPPNSAKMWLIAFVSYCLPKVVHPYYAGTRLCYLAISHVFVAVEECAYYNTTHT